MAVEQIGGNKKYDNIKKTQSILLKSLIVSPRVNTTLSKML